MYHLFDQKYSNSNIVKYVISYFMCKYIIKCNSFLWCKAEFLASLLQSLGSHDPSEIIVICCWRNISDYQCWKQLCVNS